MKLKDALLRLNLEQAKRAVEIVIEESESAALRFLEQPPEK